MSLVLLLASQASASTLTVCGTGCDAASISAAVSQASTGDTIVVHPGTWPASDISLSKDLTIRSLNGAGATTVDALGAYAFVVGSGTFVIEGFTMDCTTNGACIDVQQAGLVARDLRIEGSPQPRSKIRMVGGNASLERLFFADNGQSGGGGDGLDAECKMGGSLAIADSVFLRTYGDHGAAVHNSDGCTLLVDRSIFRDNVAAQYGGAIGDVDLIGPGIGIEVNDSWFSGNVAGEGGGAIATVAGTPMTITGSMFDANQDTSSTGSSSVPIGGGALYSDLGSVSVSASVFIGNDTGSRGGAIRTMPGASLTVAGSRFVDNNARMYGGAIRAEQAPTLEISDSHFVGNSAIQGAGGVYLFNASSTVRDSVFVENQCGTNNGGGLTLQNNNATGVHQVLDNAFFHNFSAGDAGGMLMGANGPWTDGEVSGNWFEGNEADNAGALLFRDAHAVAATDNVVIDNRATGSTFGNSGAGGFGVEGPTADHDIVRNVFCANDSTNDGGGVDCGLDNAGDCIATNNAFVSNTANSEGGGLHTTIDSVVTNNHFVANGAGSGAHWTDDFDLSNNVFTLHSSGTAASSGGLESGSYNLYWLNNNNGFTGDNAIFSDPGLTSYTPGDCFSFDPRPTTASAIVDAGDPAVIYNDIDSSRNDVGLFGGPEGFDPSRFVDNDGDGWVELYDCDDGDSGIHRGRDEICDTAGTDENCDGRVNDDTAIDAVTLYPDRDGDGLGDGNAATGMGCVDAWFVDNADDCDDHDGRVGAALTWYPDNDGDGWGDANGNAVTTCAPPSAHASNNVDCDDNDANVGAFRDYYQDLDGDLHGNPAVSTSGCTPPAGYVAAGDDCSDNDADNYPGNTELCDGSDNDCDGAIDDADPSVVGQQSWYRDADGDLYGAGAATVTCNPPVGHVLRGDDCDDSAAAVHPGQAEVCNGADDDCDGDVDESDAIDAVDWYADDDSDTYGDASDVWHGCVAPSGYVDNPDDCDDGLAAVNPDAVEVCNAGVDDDCNGLADTNDPFVQGIGTWYRDADNDGYGWASDTRTSCTAISGYVLDSSDCDDGAAAVNPGEIEVCNGIDDDCNGTADGPDADDAATWYVDADNDGHGVSTTTRVACTKPALYAAIDDDCDDTSGNIYPGAPEICDGEDNDCNGTPDDNTSVVTWYADGDGDGFGDPGVTQSACAQPSNHVNNSGDCDDADAAFNPLADEVCDTYDNDCDGSIDEDATDATRWYPDADNDGYGATGGSVTACSTPAGYVADNTDCQDGSATINPGITDTCGDGIDADCDGVGGANGDEDGDGLNWVAEDLEGTDDCLVDTDGDTVSDAIEFGRDTDGDTVPDALERDDDGDGVNTDAELAAGTHPRLTDSDGDALTDGQEWPNPNLAPPNSDGDGLSDPLDADDDNDGIPTFVETATDYDNDGIPNHLDTDSDGDTRSDAREGQGDCDGDGSPNWVDDDDHDCYDLDNDGLSDYDEIRLGTTFSVADSDGDGIPDGVEVGDPDNPTNTDGQGLIDALDDDDDNDGVPTLAEDVDGDGNPLNDDTDGDGTPDYQDSDDDGDGLFTAQEDTNNNGDYTDDDLDGDGIPDYLDATDDRPPPSTDQDEDGLTDIEEREIGSNPRKADTDGDGVPDGVEVGDVDDPTDTDDDGDYDVVDKDDDGDGIPTLDEDVDGDGDPTNDDTDGDGIADYLDADADGDGVFDGVDPDPLDKGASVDPEPDASTAKQDFGFGCGCESASGSTTSLWWLLVAGVVTGRRKRRYPASGD